MESWTDRFGEVRALLHGARTVASSRALADLIARLDDAHPERAEAELLPYARGILRAQRADRPRVRFAVAQGVHTLPGWVIALPELMIPTTTSLHVLTEWVQDEALDAHGFGFAMVGINAEGRQGRAYRAMRTHPSMARVVALELRDGNISDDLAKLWRQPWTQRLEIVDLRGNFLNASMLLPAIGTRPVLRELYLGDGLRHWPETGFKPPDAPIRLPELRTLDLSVAHNLRPAFYTDLLALLALPKLELLDLRESAHVTLQVVKDVRALLPPCAELLS